MQYDMNYARIAVLSCNAFYESILQCGLSDSRTLLVLVTVRC
jgi:hypothetical protein